MKAYERMAQRVEIIQVLMETFPREVYSRTIDLVPMVWRPRPVASAAAEFQGAGKSKPKYPVAVYWSAYSRFWDDAPEAIQPTCGRTKPCGGLSFKRVRRGSTRLSEKWVSDDLKHLETVVPAP